MDYNPTLNTTKSITTNWFVYEMWSFFSEKFGQFLAYLLDHSL